MKAALSAQTERSKIRSHAPAHPSSASSPSALMAPCEIQKLANARRRRLLDFISKAGRARKRTGGGEEGGQGEGGGGVFDAAQTRKKGLGQVEIQAE